MQAQRTAWRVGFFAVVYWVVGVLSKRWSVTELMTDLQLRCLLWEMQLQTQTRELGFAQLAFNVIISGRC
jgi:hypothetical protein